MKLYFDIGAPHNHTAVFKATKKLPPKLKSISPSSGSVGGTLITALVPGVGKETAGVKLVDKKTNETIC